MIILLLVALSTFQVQGQPDALFENAPRGDDGRFTNSVGDITHGTIGIRIPFFLRRMGGAFRDHTGAPGLVSNDGAFLRENASHSKPTLTWIGHATLLVQMEHITFLTDPIWSNTPSPIPFVGPTRIVPPGLELEDLPPIDFVVISHNHYDHLDIPTLRALAKRSPETVFFVPMGNGKLLRKNGISQVQELDWGETATVKGATIHCLPSQHWSKRSLTDDHKALWSSWAVTGSERRFYFAGDTGYFDGFKEIGEKLGPFDVAAVPIGAYEPRLMMRQSHMNPEEAVQAAVDLQAEHALAIHFGTFDLSDEPIDEPPVRFKDAAALAHPALSEAWVFDIGQTRNF